MTIRKSGAKAAVIESCNLEHDTEIEFPQVRYLNSLIERDHQAIKRQVQPMLRFKSFRSAGVTLAVIEPMHMIRKAQLKAAARRRPAQQFYSCERQSTMTPKLQIRAQSLWDLSQHHASSGGRS